MNTSSKYYNLDKTPKGWNKEEFQRVVLHLENLSRPELLILVDDLGIVFDGGNQSSNDESLIAAIIDDVPKETLIEKFS